MTSTPSAAASCDADREHRAALTRSTRLLSIAAVGVLGLFVAVQRSPATPSLYWGATIGTQLTRTHPPWGWNAVRAFQRIDAGGKHISVLGWGSSFYSTAACTGYCGFQTTEYNKVRSHGVIPWLSWASYDDDPSPRGGFTDAQVAAGSQDPYITRWARAAKSWGHPFFLRFDWEMNLSSFGWGVGANGNTSADYVAMWRHVHNLFVKAGATNVTWVWCPNIALDQSTPALASLYPGDDYVDWTCLDAYNGAEPWRSFPSLVASTYTLITTTIAPSKPMIIGEVGSTESGGNKARWIKIMLSTLRTRFTKIRGFLWFDSYERGPGGHNDWPVDSSSASEAAFTEGVASSAYKGNVYRHLRRSPIPPPS